MYINTRSILLFLTLAIINAQIIEDDTQTQSLIKPQIQENTEQENTEKQICPCLNNGQCYSIYSDNFAMDHKKQIYCRCSNYFIGKICQIPGYQVSTTKEISQKINIHNYKYFYYEPMEQNMYSFTFDLCLDNKTSSKTLEEKNTPDLVTFFLTAQNQDGGFLIDQQITKAVTISVQSDECKIITIDYTVLLITKVKTIQKLILAIKLGQKLSVEANNKIQKEKVIQKEIIKSKQKIKEVEKQIKKQVTQNQKSISQSFSNTKSNDAINQDKEMMSIKGQKIIIDYHPISYKIESQKKKSPSLKQDQIGKKQNIKSINDFKSKTPSKLKQNDDPYTSKTICVNFSVYPFMVEFVVFNILFSLTTLAAFIIVGVMIFVIRSRILGIRITRSLGISSRLINDLRHFDRFIPTQKYIKKQKKQGGLSPNSSQIQCAICLVKFQNMELIRRTPCSHSFHKSCIDTWCHENLTCPMCRKSLTQKNMAQFYNSTALQLKNSPQSDQ